MTAMSPEAAQAELRRRVRRYFLVVVSGLAGAFALPFALGAAVTAGGMEKQAAGALAGVVGVAGMFGVVALSWFLVYRWWRCPVCDRNVYWVVSMNMSFFAGAASKTCPGCGTQLIAPGSARRFFLRILLIAGLFMALGVLAGLSGLSSKRAPPPPSTQQPAPSPPG